MIKFGQSPVQFQVIINLLWILTFLWGKPPSHTSLLQLNPLKNYEKDHKLMIKLPALETFLSTG